MVVVSVALMERRGEQRRCEGREPLLSMRGGEGPLGLFLHAIKQRVVNMPRACPFCSLLHQYSVLFATLTRSLLVQALRGPLCPLIWTRQDCPGLSSTVLDCPRLSSLHPDQRGTGSMVAHKYRLFLCYNVKLDDGLAQVKSRGYVCLFYNFWQILKDICPVDCMSA